MKINNVGANHSFGKLVIDKDAEKKLYSEILLAPRDEYTLKEMLLDTIEVQKSKKNNIHVHSDGRVEVESEWTGGKSLSWGRNMFERFETALRAARSEKYQEFLTYKKENPFIDIDI